MLVPKDGSDLVPSLGLRCSQTLVGGAGQPAERNTFRADGRFLLADKRDQLCLDFLAAALVFPDEDNVREAGDFVLDSLR